VKPHIKMEGTQMKETKGTRLRAARELRDMSQGDLAKKTGISKGTISMAERDMTDLSTSHLALLCQALGVTADFIVYGETTERNDRWIKLSATKDGVSLKQTVLNLWENNRLKDLFIRLNKMTEPQLDIISNLIDGFNKQNKSGN